MLDGTGRLFAQLFEDSGDAAYLMDPRDELLTLTVTDIHPAEMAQLRAFLEDALDHGRASRVKFTCRTKAGVFLPTEISIHVVERGSRRYILGLVQDRSEHRQSVAAC